MSLKNITIPNSVTSIEYKAFEHCGLENVIIPNNVTIIANETFRKCIMLKSITIPDRVTDIKDSAFEGCINLENINIPKNAHVDPTAFRCCDYLNTGRTMSDLCTKMNQYISQYYIENAIKTYSGFDICRLEEKSNEGYIDAVNNINDYIKNAKFPNESYYNIDFVKSIPFIKNNLELYIYMMNKLKE